MIIAQSSKPRVVRDGDIVPPNVLLCSNTDGAQEMDINDVIYIDIPSTEYTSIINIENIGCEPIYLIGYVNNFNFENFVSIDGPFTEFEMKGDQAYESECGQDFVLYEKRVLVQWDNGLRAKDFCFTNNIEQRRIGIGIDDKNCNSVKYILAKFDDYTFSKYDWSSCFPTCLEEELASGACSSIGVICETCKLDPSDPSDSSDPSDVSVLYSFGHYIVDIPNFTLSDDYVVLQFDLRGNLLKETKITAKQFVVEKITESIEIFQVRINGNLIFQSKTL